MSRNIDFVVFPVEDVDVFEEHVWGSEVLADDLAVEGESHGLVVRVFSVKPYSDVAEGLVVIGIEVMFALLDVGRQNDEEGVRLSSLLTLRQQQVLWVAVVMQALEAKQYADLPTNRL